VVLVFLIRRGNDLGIAGWRAVANILKNAPLLTCIDSIDLTKAGLDLSSQEKGMALAIAANVLPLHASTLVSLDLRSRRPILTFLNSSC
jgi:hypothetical protein